MDLFDQINDKSARQRNMALHFQKKSETSIAFSEVDIDRVKSSKADKDKGLIVPSINYIEDVNENG